ncbi:MAG: Ig-like domain-containing protein [Marinilabiliales bacterium]|nr:Ig-like domain-containing protein [Marinilabiliales bacterium]
MTLYPRITVLFDAPVDQTSATDGIRLLNSQSVAIAKVREISTTTEGKGAYSFELSEALQRNSTYRIVLDAGAEGSGWRHPRNHLRDIIYHLHKGVPAPETWWSSFDNISAFWDP